MKRIYLKALYNSAKTAQVPLLFNDSLKTMIPDYTDENGDPIDADFITYYYENYSLFDRYIRYTHGSKIYKYDDEEFQTALAAFKDHIEALMFANIDEFASMFAKETQAHKMMLGTKIFKTDTLGERTGSKTYGEDVTRNSYAQDKTTDVFGQDKTTDVFGQDKTTDVIGAKHSEATSPQKKTTTNNYNRSYELEVLEQTSKSEAISDLFVDELDEDARTDTSTRDTRTDTSTRDSRTDTSTRDARTDTITRDEKIDSYQDDQTINTYETIDNSRYYENMKAIPEFEDCMKRIINKLIIESGCSYEY